jgi:hypothetical protein
MNIDNCIRTRVSKGSKQTAKCKWKKVSYGSGPLTGRWTIFPSHKRLDISRKITKFHEMPFVEPSIFLQGEMTNVAAIVSAVNLQAFLGWLYGQFLLVHLRPLQVKLAQILVGKSLGKISVALISCLARKNMPMSMTGRCLAGLVAPLRWGFFWHWEAAAFVLLAGEDGSCFASRR